MTKMQDTTLSNTPLPRKFWSIGIDSAAVKSAAAVVDERGYYITSQAFFRPKDMKHNWLWMSDAICSYVEQLVVGQVRNITYFGAVEAAIRGKMLFNLEAGVQAILNRNGNLAWHGTISARTVDRILLPDVKALYRKYPGSSAANKKERREGRKGLMREWVDDAWESKVQLDTQDEVDACLIAEILRLYVLGEVKI